VSPNKELLAKKGWKTAPTRWGDLNVGDIIQIQPG
jgi:hypothetical protein